MTGLEPHASGGQRQVVAQLYEPSDGGSPPRLVGVVPTLLFAGGDSGVAATLHPAPGAGDRFTNAAAFAMVGQPRTLAIEHFSYAVMVVGAQVVDDGRAMEVELIVQSTEEPVSGP